MDTQNYTCLPDVINMFTKHYSDEPNEFSQKDFANVSDDDENRSDLDEIEEVFSDHIFMGQRLRKRLYAGQFDDFKEIPDHPPIALTGLALELFSKAVPNYGLDILDMDYVASASEATRVSPCAMILAMMYLERLKIKHNEYLETASPSGLFVVTMLVASKFLFEDEDDIVTNQMWAEALNYDVKDLNNLEYEFLSAIEWNIFVKSSEYFNYLSEIEKVVAFRQSSYRGWLSYSDIYVLEQDMIFYHFWSNLFKQIIKALTVWTLGYVASTLVLHGTGIILHKCFKTGQVPTEVMPNNFIELKTAIFDSHQQAISDLLSTNMEENLEIFSQLSFVKQILSNYEKEKMHCTFNDKFYCKSPFVKVSIDYKYDRSDLFKNFNMHYDSHYKHSYLNDSWQNNNTFVNANKVIWSQGNSANYCIALQVR